MHIPPALSNKLQWFGSPAVREWGRYFGIVNVSLTGALVLFYFLGISEEAQLMVDNSHHVLPLSVKFLPVPIAFLLWARMAERDRPFSMRFSAVWLGVSIGAFIATLLLSSPLLRHLSMALGVIAGLFVWIPFRDCIARMAMQPRLAVVMLIAATASLNYYWLMQALWVEMRGLTTHVVFFVLQFFGADAYAVVHPRVNTTIFIRSPNFMIWVNNACNGLEGIFLFNFLLSVMFLLDWQIFRRRWVFLTYLAGIAYMFLINALRITLFFTIGYWAYKPDVPDWVQSMQGWPVIMFHSYIGWVLYLIAFGIFALWLYRSSRRPAALPVDTTLLNDESNPRSTVP